MKCQRPLMTAGWPPVQACAASRINREISSGREISETWLVFTSMVLAPHAFRHESLQVRIDGAIFGRDSVIARFRSPSRVRGFSGQQGFGAEALLTKPIDFGTLRSKIDSRVESAVTERIPAIGR